MSSQNTSFCILNPGLKLVQQVLLWSPTVSGQRLEWTKVRSNENLLGEIIFNKKKKKIFAIENRRRKYFMSRKRIFWGKYFLWRARLIAKNILRKIFFWRARLIAKEIQLNWFLDQRSSLWWWQFQDTINPWSRVCTKLHTILYGGGSACR